MKLRPIDGRIIVRLIEKKRTGLIHIPDQALQKHSFGIVETVADDINLQPGERIEEGDLIYFKYYAGMEISFEGKKVIFIPRSEVVGITKKAEVELGNEWQEA